VQFWVQVLEMPNVNNDGFFEYWNQFSTDSQFSIIKPTYS